jgi:hypothetical protein
MPKYAPNKMPAEVKRHYFELIRMGVRGARAAAQVGVSLSCGSVWFIDAGSVHMIDTPISSRFLSQNDRIEIADGLGHSVPIKAIAERIGKSYQSIYRRLRVTASRTAAISRGTPTTRPTCAGDGPSHAGSRSTPGCGEWSTTGW